MSNVINLTARNSARAFPPTFAVIEQGTRDLVKFQAFGPNALAYALVLEAAAQSGVSARTRASVVVPFRGCEAPAHADDDSGCVGVFGFGSGAKALVVVLTRASAAALAGKAAALGFVESQAE